MNEKPTFEMVQDVLLTGGLYRCCIATWEKEISLRGYEAGTMITCRQCGENMIRDDQGKWRWNYEGP